jgi:ABC-type maltose transport system permease subunit
MAATTHIRRGRRVPVSTLLRHVAINFFMLLIILPLAWVLLPLAVNGVVVVAIVNFVAAWGEYLLAATLTNDQSVRTMPVVLASTQGGMGQWAWPRIAAVYIIVVTPGIVVFALLQRL